MPTTRPRHTITETDEVARALDAATRRWPAEAQTRGRLLVRLIAEGARALDREHDAGAADRRAALARTRGALTGVYWPGYLEGLREEWPT